MLRLCSDSSRSYPGRSVRNAVSFFLGLRSAWQHAGYRTEVSKSHSRRRTPSPCDWTAGNKPGKHPGSLTPPKGRTKKGEEPQ